MQCVRVLKKDAETVRKQLILKNIFSRGYSPVSGRKYVYFPVLKKVSGYIFVEKNVVASPKEYLAIGAYDHIGDIVIVPEKTKKDVALQLLKRKDVKVVLRRRGIYHGEFRTQDLEWLAGEKRKESVCRENGVSLRLDVEKCYFSPRLSTERMRVASLIRPGEKVLVLFSGVGPYPLVFAKHSKASLIVGVEKNSLAHYYSLQNCKKSPQIRLYNLDVLDFRSSERFDRIVMPHPKSGEDFLSFALGFLRQGGVVHFYTFASGEDIPEKPLALLRTHVRSFRVLAVVKCGQYAPRKYRVCVDFLV